LSLVFVVSQASPGRTNIQAADKQRTADKAAAKAELDRVNSIAVAANSNAVTADYIEAMTGGAPAKKPRLAEFGRKSGFGRVGALRRPGRRSAASLPVDCLKTEMRTHRDHWTIGL